ncbi:MAG: succinylglutamate desuccinylase [Acidobacteriota bacterium]
MSVERDRIASRRFGLGLLLVVVVVIVVGGREFRRAAPREVVVAAGVRTTSLSAYAPGLKGTPGDTAVYVLEGGQPGGTMLVMGGVHANEPAGTLTAVLLVERARVKAGRLFVIARANASAATHVESAEGYPTGFSIATPSGKTRWFRFGGRLTNPVHQWPDPEVYTHYPSGQLQSDFDVRNLDRAFPGRPDGVLTEQIAFGITELIRQERVDLTVDLHEARPMNPIVNCVIFHERAQEIATMASIDLEAEGVKLRLEPSPRNLHGMSHRELGDHTSTAALLLESANPIMDRLHGKTSGRLILDGKDEFFARAARAGLLYVPYGDEGLPLEERVGRHLAASMAFNRLFGEIHPGRGVVIDGVPDYATLKTSGIGRFLKDPVD